MQNDVGVQHHLIEQNEKFVRKKIRNMKVNVQTLGEDLESKLQSLSEDVVVLKKTILQGASPATDTPPKVRVSEPKGLSGNQNAKELENFHWDMEQFFQASHVLDGEKVQITSMYLSGDA